MFLWWGPDRGGRIARRARWKNVEFPAGNCAFVETEEGLLEAWERKILIFLQENNCFCGVGHIVADGELGGQGGKTLRFLQEIVQF